MIKYEVINVQEVNFLSNKQKNEKVLNTETLASSTELVKEKENHANSVIFLFTRTILRTYQMINKYLLEG